MRVGLSPIKCAEDECGYLYKFKGRGQRPKYVKNPVTPLYVCDVCGKRSTPKKIHIRSDVYGWNKSSYLSEEKSKGLLCTGCWNRVKAVVKKQREADEIRYLKDKLYREVLKWQKLQTQAN